MTVEFLELACQTCRWRPGRDVSMGIVREHVATEHPDQLDPDGEPDVLLEMVAVCPRCSIEIPLFRSIDRGSYLDLEYVCEKCHRGYGVRQDKSDG